MNKRYMIRCDIEGVSGVVSCEQADPGKPEYTFGLRMFKSDLLSCVNGLLEGGADEIIIYDEHYYGRNIDPEWLPDKVLFIAGKPPYRGDWAGGLDASFAGVVLLGFHSMAGTPNGLLHHSYEPDIRSIRLNGVTVGEIGMEAAIAGDFGVPVVLVTGDSAGVAEAEALLPGVRVVAVKESLGETGGRCLPLSVTAPSIRESAMTCVSHPPAVQPLIVKPPVILEVELNDGVYLKAVRRIARDKMADERTLKLTGRSVTKTWADYWRIKIAAQVLLKQTSIKNKNRKEYL